MLCMPLLSVLLNAGCNALRMRDPSDIIDGIQGVFQLAELVGGIVKTTNDGGGSSRGRSRNYCQSRIPQSLDQGLGAQGSDYRSDYFAHRYECKCPRHTVVGGSSASCRKYNGYRYFPQNIRPNVCKCVEEVFPTLPEENQSAFSCVSGSCHSPFGSMFRQEYDYLKMNQPGQEALLDPEKCKMRCTQIRGCRGISIHLSKFGRMTCRIWISNNMCSLSAAKPGSGTFCHYNLKP